MIKGYETKDVKASKTKKKGDGVILKEDDGLFYFEWEGQKHGFTLEENAEIALNRFKNGE
jgi:hypothetical protein